MGFIIMLLGLPFVILLYLIFFGGKECYFCGRRLDEKDRPIYSMNKRSCTSCCDRNADPNL